MFSHFPAISVVLPVHNYGAYLKNAIDSILNQGMADFELIIVNDGSTDNSGLIARSYNDKRIKNIDFRENRGCYPARNAGMKAARGKYICVMDADDICTPNRLEIQYNFLEKHPDIGLIGGAYQLMNNYNTIFRETDNEIIKLMLMNYCYLLHPTCMVRSSMVKKHDLFYDEQYRYASDYDWQVRASSLFPVSNINEPVLLYRSHDQQISKNKSEEQSHFADHIRMKQLSFLGIIPTDEEAITHLSFIFNIQENNIDIRVIDDWIDKLINANNQKKYYHQQKFQHLLEAFRYKYTHHQKDI